MSLPLSLEFFPTKTPEGADKLRMLQRVVDTVDRRQHHTERAREIEIRGSQVVTAKAVLAFTQRVVEVVRQEAPQHAERIVARVTHEIMVAGCGPGSAAAAVDEPD